MIRDILNRAVAGAVAAGAAMVAVIALGATVFYLLSLVLLPVGASAATAALFFVVAAVAYMVFANKAAGEDEEEIDEEEPEGLPARLLHLVQQRPVIGIVAALGAGAVLLRKPGLAALAMTAFQESRKPKGLFGNLSAHKHDRYGRRRNRRRR